MQRSDSVWRLQWRCITFRLFEDDLGDSVDFLGMSPPLVAAAAQRSAVRWRTRRVLADQPTLADVRADGLTGADGSQLSLLVARPIGQLLKGRGRPTRTVPQWTPQCRSYLLSAATGGQWPQVRIAGIRNAVDADDHRCQLCLAAPGTLAHRRCCPASPPPGAGPAQRTGLRRGFLKKRGPMRGL